MESAEKYDIIRHDVKFQQIRVPVFSISHLILAEIQTKTSSVIYNSLVQWKDKHLDQTFNGKKSSENKTII